MTRNGSASREPYVSVGPSADVSGAAPVEQDLEAKWRSLVGRRSFLRGVGLAGAAAVPGSALFASQAMARSAADHRLDRRRRDQPLLALARQGR